VLCTYPLAACGALEILDVVRTHQFALAKRHGSWDVIETAGHKQAKAEIKLLNEELEQRVVERTNQLMLASEALREAQTELAHVNRVTTMGELSASIAHEVMQPVTAAVTNAHAALRWLGTQPPDLEEIRQALGRIVKEGNRATDVIGRIRALIKKAPPRKDSLEINEAILEVIALTRGEAVKNGVSVQTQLAEGLPLIQGDRVQLQQVILNLIINAAEAMNGVSEGSRELQIGTGKDASGGVLVAVQDSGPGLKPESSDRLFDAFYTTKPGGMGMGLSICRSIVEGHGGRIWVSRNAGPGATVQFTVPVG
jgi:C4-dicarboxylate-specific signal transduction histidine kinase